MVTDFDDNERSVSQSRPIDLYTIVTPTETHRMTSNVVDVTYLGAVFTATTMSRGNLQTMDDPTGREFIVYLPITHPFVQRYVVYGVPEHQATVTIQRMQTVSGTTMQVWSGFADTMTITGSDDGSGSHVAMLRVPSVIDDAMRRRLPVIAAQRLCNHVLYDAQCTVNRATAVSGGPFVITSINGDTITTSSLGGGSQYVFGEVVHLATGQRRMVVGQASNLLALSAAFAVANVGDSVELAPGCDHSILTCRDKFSNVVNFGGHPQLNGAS